MSEMPSKSPDPIRIVVLEECPVIREGLTRCLGQHPDFDLCAQTATHSEVLAAITSCRADVLLMDVVHEGQDGIEFTRHIMEKHPALRVLVFSSHDESVYAERLLRAGAMGFVSKRDPVSVLHAALRAVAAGEIYVSPRLSLVLLGRLLHPALKNTAKTGVAGLTNRELHVFQLLGAGLRLREIGSRLGVSTKTVQAHRENIKNKLGFDTAAELLRHAALWLTKNSRNPGGRPNA